MGSFRLQEAFVEVGVRLQKLAAGLNAGKAMVVTGVKTMAFAAIAVASAAFAGLTAVIGGAIPLVKLGSDLEEMRSKFAAVFKEEEGAAREFASGLADGVGRSQVAIEGFMSSFQDLFVPMGFARKDARELSQTITKLGIDLASFNNMTDDEALQTLNAGLTGSHEVLKKFGVFVNDNVLSLKLQQMGLAKNAQEASEQAKMMARLQIVLDSTSDAHGDAARTSDSLANQWKRLTGTLFDLASSIGTALIPSAKGVVGAFQHVTDWVKSNESKVSSFASMVGEAFDQAFGFISDQISRLVNVWQQNWELFGPVVMEAFGLVSSIFFDALASIFSGIVSLIEWWGGVQRAIFQVAGYTQEGMASMGQSITATWEWIKEAVGGAVEWIKSAIETAIFTIMNWDLAAKRIGIGMAEVFTNVGGRISNVFENAGIAVSWFFNNFRDIAFSAFDALATAFINLGENIKAIWKAALEYIKTGEFKPNLKPILDGAKSTIKEMPKFKAFEPGDFSDQWQELEDETFDRMQAWKAALAEQAPKAVSEGIEEGAADAMPKLDVGKIELPNITPNDKGKQKETKEKNSNAGNITDVASVWKEMQKSILQGGDKLPKEQLDVAKQQLAETKDMNKKLDKPATVGTFG